jgi:molybdate transport system ATP-binding protein
VLRSPRNARVAQLVGIHNYFAGQFHTAPAPSVYVPSTVQSYGQLRWGSQRLHVQDKGKIANDTEVTWVIAGDLVQVLEAGPASSNKLAASAQDNLLLCRLVEMLPLGEISVCKLAVHGTPEADNISLNLSTALLRSLQAGVGTELLLHLPAQALHIMPVRELGVN